MTTDEQESLRGRIIRGRSVRGAQFVGCDLGNVVIRGSDISGMELDSPWLIESGESLVVNGVDVVGYVDGELNRRFPGRELRTARDSAGLREAWSSLESAWAATVSDAVAMPVGTIDATVGGEWSFAQTLRHLVMATDTWLGHAILRLAQPYHPAGLPNDDDDAGEGGEADGGDASAATSAAYDLSVFSNPQPSFDEVLAARASRHAMVRDYLAGVTAADLVEPRANPHSGEPGETVLSCMHTILEEEWEHLRYAVRDLGALGSDDGSA